MKRLVVSALATMGLLSIVSCGALPNKTATCASPAGQDVILGIVKEQIEKIASRTVEGDNGVSLVTTGNLRASISSIVFTIDDVRTSKEDPDSTKKFCAGTLKAVVPVQMIADAERVFELVNGSNLNALVDQHNAERSANTIKIPLDFTVQPTDDRKTIYGEIEAPGSISTLFSELVTAGALKSRVEQIKADQAHAEAENIRLEAEAKTAERNAIMAEARSRFEISVQSINAAWQSLPAETRETMLPQQTAFNQRKRATCNLEAAQYSTDPTEREAARLNCESQLMNARSSELARYIRYDGY